MSCDLEVKVDEDRDEFELSISVDIEKLISDLPIERRINGIDLDDLVESVGALEIARGIADSNIIDEILVNIIELFPGQISNQTLELYHEAYAEEDE